MKSSAIALMTAAALLFGANSVSLAQDATTTTPTANPASAEECAVLENGGTTDTNVSLTESDEDTEEGTDGMANSGSVATQDNMTDNDTDEGAIDCPDDTSASGATTTTSTAASPATTTTDECLEQETASLSEAETDEANGADDTAVEDEDEADDTDVAIEDCPVPAATTAQ
jgi:hypothetical protein